VNNFIAFNKLKEAMIKELKEDILNLFYNKHYVDKEFIELATLYHFPGEVAATPTLPRIDSVKSSSPSNLPI
jgi:hypothetical protein